MILAPRLTETLQLVGRAMRGAVDDWRLIGSAAVSLHCVTRPEAADVDVLLSRRDAGFVFQKLEIKPENLTPHPTFQSSSLGRWDHPPLTVEFMSDFRILSQGEWGAPLVPKSRQAFPIGLETVFAPSRPELIEILEAFARPKGLDRARQLRTAL